MLRPVWHHCSRSEVTLDGKNSIDEIGDQTPRCRTEAMLNDHVHLCLVPPQFPRSRIRGLWSTIHVLTSYQVIPSSARLM